jgi:hypothetical protein
MERKVMHRHIQALLWPLGLVVGALFLYAASGSTAADKEPAEKKTATQTFMREKLKDAQRVLEGLATADFKLVKQGAEHMEIMSRATEWHVVEGPVYAQYSAEFRRNCEQLIKRAEEKNIDSATLAYLQLTMSCINCHKFMQGTQIVQNGRGPSMAMILQK